MSSMELQSGLEPFPMFVDYSPSTMAALVSNILQLFNSSLSILSISQQRWVPRKLDHYLRLRYYQYEVTFGLYVMTPAEKSIINTFVLVTMVAIAWALFTGLEPWLIKVFCHLVYYIKGNLEGTDQLCE